MEPVSTTRHQHRCATPPLGDRLLQSVLDTENTPLLIVDRKGQPLKLNDAARPLVDHGNLLDLLDASPSHTNGNAGPLDRVFETGRGESLDIEVDLDGAARQLHIEICPLHDDNQAISAALLKCCFATRRAEAVAGDTTLHPSPQIRVQQGMLTLRAGKAVVANRGFLNIFGLSNPRDVRGRSLSSFLDPSCRDRVSDLVRRWSADTPQGDPVDLRGIRSDGSPIDIRVRSATGASGSHDVLRLDVTRLPSQADQVIPTPVDYFAPYDALPEEVVVIDEQRRVLFMNKAARTHYGDQRGQACTQDLFGCNAVCDDCLLKDIFERPGTVCHREVQRNGRSFDIVAVTLQPDAVGQPMRAMMIGRDMTVEETNHDREKMESIGLLARSIAHDFNNIMVGVVGYASLIRDLAQPDSEIAECAQLIEQSGQTVRNLTRNLQVFAGRSKPKPQVVCLNDVVSMTAQLVQKTIKSNINLSVCLEPQLWYSESDPDQIHQVLLNLCINASEAMGSTGGNLSIHTSNITCNQPRSFAGQTCPAGRYVQIEIADTGKGMEPELVKKCFEPMFSTKGRGRGFGLATVFGIIKVSGGWVQIDSRLGRGSTFRVGLPATRKAPKTPSEDTADLPRGNETILIADDEASVRDLASRMLSGLGYRVLVACDGMEAYEKVQAHGGEIDLVVLDIVMPRMSGGEAYKAIRRINPDQRILFSSGYEKDGLLETVAGQEKLPFLHKPYRLTELARSVRSALDDRVEA